MRKHGYTWPSIMRCDYFPLDNNMCIQSQAGRPNTPPQSRPAHPRAPSSRDQPKVNQTASSEDEKIFRRVLDFICKSDWGKMLLFEYCCPFSLQ